MGTAVDIYSENPNWASPRISFSCDLVAFDEAGGIPVERCGAESSPLIDSKLMADFDFCVGRMPENEPPSADELFAGGKILPLQLKPKQSKLPQPAMLPPPPPPERKKGALKEITTTRKNGLPEKSPEREKPAGGSPRSFWLFRRSISLNFGDGHRWGSIWSLQVLSRSNSAGSADSRTRGPTSKPSSDPHPGPKLHRLASASSPSPSSPLQKPPLRKAASMGRARYASYPSHFRHSPALNIPPPYIPNGNHSLFGFGYLFRTQKETTANRKTKTTKQSFSQIGRWLQEGRK